jgi:hypothetical protein
VAIALGNAAVPVVDAQLRPLVTADLPALVDRLLLGVEVAGGTPAAAALDIPAPGGARYYMM